MPEPNSNETRLPGSFQSAIDAAPLPKPGPAAEDFDTGIRRRLLAFLKQHPGCTVHRASLGIGLPRDRLLRHLGALKESGRVAELGQRPRTLLVLNCPGIHEQAEQLRALADPDVRAAYQWLATLGQAHPEELIRRAAERYGCSPKTMRRRVSLLVRVGLVEHRREGRLWTWLRALPPAEPVRDALHSAESASPYSEGPTSDESSFLPGAESLQELTGPHKLWA